jgi:predicted metalloprotease with PDZ domain
MGTPASKADVSAGDEIVAIDGRRIDAANQRRRLDSLLEGQNVTLTLFRREKLMTVNLAAAVKPPDRYSIKPVKDATAAQKALYRAWVRADYQDLKEGAREG